MEWHVHVGSHSSDRPALEPRVVVIKSSLKAYVNYPFCAYNVMSSLFLCGLRNHIGYLTLIFLNLEGVEGKLQNVDLDIVLNILTSSCHHFTESESRREVHLIDPVH